MRTKYAQVGSLLDYLRTGGTEEAARLADKAQTKPVYLWQVANGYRRAGPRLATSIEQETRGLVTREELRPDIYAPVPRAGVE